MVLAPTRFAQKRLIARHGPVGVVAARYLEAGLSVRVFHPTRLGPVHVLAWGHGQRRAVEVYNSSRPPSRELVERVAEKARLVRATPVLVLYGSTPGPRGEAREAAERLGVALKRVRGSRLPHDWRPK